MGFCFHALFLLISLCVCTHITTQQDSRGLGFSCGMSLGLIGDIGTVAWGVSFFGVSGLGSSGASSGASSKTTSTAFAPGADAASAATSASAAAAAAASSSDFFFVEAAAAAASRAASALAGAGAVLGAGMAALDDSAVSGTRGSFVGVSGGALGLGTAPALAAGAPPAPPAPPPPPAGFFFFLPPAIVWRTTGKSRRNVMTPIDGHVLQRKIQIFRDRIGEKCAASSAQSTVRIHLGCVRRFGAHTHLFAPRTLGDSST